MTSLDHLVVRTLRCGRSNPGSNPGLGNSLHQSLLFCDRSVLFCLFLNNWNFKIIVYIQSNK